MICNDRDLDTVWKSAADSTMEARYFYLQNWRADVCAITNATGITVRSYRYTAYGTRTEIDEGDFNRDGGVDYFDYLDWLDDFSMNNPRGDVNHDGVFDTVDDSDFVDMWANAGTDKLGGATRNLYAGYENDPVVELTVASANGSVMPVVESYYHVRNRVYSTELGRWTRRDPLGYHDGMGLEEYVRSKPARLRDPSGLLCTSPIGDRMILEMQQRVPGVFNLDCPGFVLDMFQDPAIAKVADRLRRCQSQKWGSPRVTLNCYKCQNSKFDPDNNTLVLCSPNDHNATRQSLIHELTHAAQSCENSEFYTDCQQSVKDEIEAYAAENEIGSPYGHPSLAALCPMACQSAGAEQEGLPCAAMTLTECVNMCKNWYRDGPTSLPSPIIIAGTHR